MSAPALNPDSGAGCRESAVREGFAAIVGRPHVLTGDDAAPYCTDWRGLFHGAALAVLRPGCTAEVSACVRFCAEAGLAVVPQGGNTGLCGGATPRDGEVVLSLARLNRVRDIDAVDLTMTVEAGVTLAAARSAASEMELSVPLSLASEGSAQIGGVISTNAGGNATLRFGNTRELVLGLEVVMADGRVWNGLRRLRKDNTGLALRHLFIGSEGTLGIVTAACLRLMPEATYREVAFVAVPSVQAALDLLGTMRQADEAALHAFEYVSGNAFRMVLEQMPGLVDPFAASWPDYVLVELASRDAGLRVTLESALERALADGVVCDVAIAGNEAQRAALWNLRDHQAEAQSRAGLNIKNDISVPVSRVPAFCAAATSACRMLLQGVHVVPFGHLGDGNIHFNLVAPRDTDPAIFAAQAAVSMQTVGEIARTLDGSFSAEHGVGQLKTALLADWRQGVELDLMRQIKAALDPNTMFNPGKILV